MCKKTKPNTRRRISTTLPTKAVAKCNTKYCRRPAKGRFCYHCQREQKKERNPYRYWYGVNKRNAKRRALKAGNGKFWYVTFEHWVKFCDETGYLAIKGRHKDAASVDCKINELGYIDGNIRVLTVGENASKGAKRVTWNYITREWEIIPPPPLVKKFTDDELPF